MQKDPAKATVEDVHILSLRSVWSFLNMSSAFVCLFPKLPSDSLRARLKPPKLHSILYDSSNPVIKTSVMNHFDSILHALLFRIPSHGSDVSETIVSDDPYLDDTSMSTVSSNECRVDRYFHNMGNESSPTTDFSRTKGLFISSKRIGRSVPIACPSPSQDHLREQEFEEDLTTMYNESTWRMYHRIVNARRKQALKRKEAHQSFVDDDRDPIREPTCVWMIKRPQPYGNVPGMFCAQSLPINSQTQVMIESSSDVIPSEIQFFHMD